MNTFKYQTTNSLGVKTEDLLLKAMPIKLRINLDIYTNGSILWYNLGQDLITVSALNTRALAREI